MKSKALAAAEHFALEVTASRKRVLTRTSFAFARPDHEPLFGNLHSMARIWVDGSVERHYGPPGHRDGTKRITVSGHTPDASGGRKSSTIATTSDDLYPDQGRSAMIATDSATSVPAPCQPARARDDGFRREKFSLLQNRLRVQAGFYTLRAASATLVDADLARKAQNFRAAGPSANWAFPALGRSPTSQPQIILSPLFRLRMR